MARDPKRPAGDVSRRKFVLATAGVGAAAIAGCSGDGSTGGDTTPTADGDGNSTGTPMDQATPTTQSLDTSVLTGDGSSTVYPITSRAASFWNSNPERGDGDYWPDKWAKQYGTKQRLADYFASLYGYEPTGKRSKPPFRVSIALSHSGTGVEGVMEGRIDIGDSSAPAKAELAGSNPGQETLNDFTDHVVGVDGQPIVASNEIVDAGVEQITIEELRGIYRGEITNWSELGGPDKEILALGRAAGSGTATAFRLNVFGDANASLSPDQRFAQNQQLQQAVTRADNAIAYIALAFVEPDGGTPPIDLKIDDTVYSYGKNLGAKEYPLSRDLHAYTWKGTSRKEAAFINFVLSDFGQQHFVQFNNYFALPEERRTAQREKIAPSNYE